MRVFRVKKFTFSWELWSISATDDTQSWYVFASHIHVHIYLLIGYWRDRNKPRICRKQKAIKLKILWRVWPLLGNGPLNIFTQKQTRWTIGGLLLGNGALNRLRKIVQAVCSVSSLQSGLQEPNSEAGSCTSTERQSSLLDATRSWVGVVTRVQLRRGNQRQQKRRNLH